MIHLSLIMAGYDQMDFMFDNSPLVQEMTKRIVLSAIARCFYELP